MEDLLGIPASEAIYASAKAGTGAEDVLQAVVQRIPPPAGRPDAPPRALIFDSHYDSYKGVVAYIRVIDGTLGSGDLLLLMSNGLEVDPIEIGVFRPGMQPTQRLDCLFYTSPSPRDS